jgi:DNA-binding transcriptional regulator YhcF (GntR family)
VIEEGRALFLQIAEQVEDSIIGGMLGEDAQAPSTNELAAFYRINPATAAKGIGVLVDKGILYKRRGIGMFVAAGARATLLAERREAFASRFIDPLLLEARKLALGADELSTLIRERDAAALERSILGSPGNPPTTEGTSS